MKTKVSLLFALTVLSLTTYSCQEDYHSNSDSHDHSASSHESDATHSNEIIFTPQQAASIGLEVETIQAGTFNQVIHTSGQILTTQGDEITLVATTNGIVRFTDSSLNEGSTVHKGKSLFIISAQSIVDGDPIAKARIEYETSEKELHRAKGLIQDNIISTKEFEQIEQRYETAKAAYVGIGDHAQGDGIVISAQMSGFIKNIQVGQGDYVTVGQPLATLTQTQRLRLRAEISERYFDQLPRISGANFKLPYSNRLYQLSELNGRLLSYGKASNDASFYIPVTFEFNNAGDIIAGSYADIYLLATPKNNTISVPLSALTEEQGLYFVYLRLDEEGYKKQEVSLGQNNGNRVEILSGLRSGDVIVTKGAYHIKLASVSGAIPEGHNH